MSKKQTHKSTRSNKSYAKIARARRAGKAVESTKVAASATAGNEQDSRLPAVGTTIKKLDRHGKLRCKCTVTPRGIRYNGTVYSSVSAAAMAAAGDLGLESPTQNGFAFWGLNKPAVA